MTIFVADVSRNLYTAIIVTVLGTAFGSVTFPTVIWLCILKPNGNWFQTVLKQPLAVIIIAKI